MRTLYSYLFPALLSIVFLPAGHSQVKKGGNGPFFNLKLIKPTEVDSQMTAYRVALGVDCGYCHMPGNYVTDENFNKVTTRKMILLTREINERNFSGAELVTCYTCHHGAEMPLMKPAPSK